MNTVEHPPPVNAYVSNSKVSVSSRPPSLSDDTASHAASHTSQPPAATIPTAPSSAQSPSSPSSSETPAPAAAAAAAATASSPTRRTPSTSAPATAAPAMATPAAEVPGTPARAPRAEADMDDSAVPSATPARGGDGPASAASSVSTAAGTAGAAASEESVEWLHDFNSLEEISVDADTQELLVKVPSESVGRMIGRNGQVIKDLQGQSGAFINMGKDGDVHRIARISGNYPETHLCALLLVQKFTPRENAPKQEKLETMIRFCRKNRNVGVQPHTVEEFAVPEESLGRVIGRGGHMLREIQERSHARIDLPKTAATAGHRVLVLSGSPEEIASCRDLLKAQIGLRDEQASTESQQESPSGPPGPNHNGHMRGYGPSDPLLGSRPPYYLPTYGPPSYAPYPMQYYPPPPPGYDPGMYPPPYATSYGYVPQYAPPYPPAPYGLSDMAADFGRVALSPPHEGPDPDHQVPLSHHHPGGPHAHAHMAPPLPLHATAPAFVPSMMPPPTALMPQQHEAVVPIPGELVGRLIGRQGVSVKQLQLETRTRIDVLDPSPHAVDTTRYVRITALRPENVRMCEAHIRARVAAHYGSTF